MSQYINVLCQRNIHNSNSIAGSNLLYQNKKVALPHFRSCIPPNTFFSHLELQVT